MRNTQSGKNNRFLNISYFADLALTANNSWYFGVTADVVNYSSESFAKKVSIPLIGAEVSFNFLTNKRGMLTLEVSDLLDKNTGIERISEMNYLRETRSDIIGRYVMLAFKYRINKAAKSNGGLEIDVKRR